MREKVMRLKVPSLMTTKVPTTTPKSMGLVPDLESGAR